MTANIKTKKRMFDEINQKNTVNSPIKIIYSISVTLQLLCATSYINCSYVVTSRRRKMLLCNNKYVVSVFFCKVLRS